ncbi:hypothetical protein DH2020_040519 [Rehmannia glutinosa]|uniref:Ubiquitin carboxyl-terminal hydrolase n=1 Tax=Rehmannia glutinosa TaxID=99300 RepID=A0ABR0UUX1_REHGL
MKIPESIKLSSIINKPRHGSKINWVFHSGLKISTSAGVLGAVGLVLAIKAKRYLDFNYSDQDVASTRSLVVPGLQNLGNNCFLNVVLQALSSCSSFRKYLLEMVEEYGPVSVEEGDESIPLVNSLTSLVEELCTIRHKRTVLSPRKLMVLMDHYVPNFNLTMQQDAEEAFSHLLSALREEISEHFVPNKSCLADLPALQNGRILITKNSEDESEWQRWSRSFLKPFDGILCSFLICQSCSFQMAGCTLEDCLTQFCVAEHVENYCCSNCWHNAAIEYVSAFTKDKTVIEKLRCCNKNDSCGCKDLSSLEAFPWSNRFSRTFKQLSISRSPKILCIHLQRASYNMFGQSVKLQGHISFPLILDLSPFMNTGVGIKHIGANSQFGPLNRSRKIRSFPYSKYQTMLLDPGMLSCKATKGKSISSETKIAGEQERNTITVENGPCSKAFETSLLDSERRADGNGHVFSPLAPNRHQMYRLVSVVVHYGTSGGGHYTVYRKVTARLGDEDPVALLESAIEQWFCI